MLESNFFKTGSTVLASRIPALSGVYSKTTSLPVTTMSAFAIVSIELIVDIYRLALVRRKIMQPRVNA